MKLIVLALPPIGEEILLVEYLWNLGMVLLLGGKVAVGAVLEEMDDDVDDGVLLFP